MEVIAKVYGHEIRRSEFMRELNRLDKIVDNFMICTLQKKALTVIIDRYLLLHEAEDEHIEITPEEYNEELFDFINEYDTEDEFDAMLLKNHYTEQNIREIVTNKILLRKHIQKYQTASDEIPEEKLRSFYKQNKNLFQTQEEVCCKHILVKDPTAESKVRAEWIRREIHNAEDFYEAIAKYSECPTVKRCGDLGFFHRGKLIKEIDDVAFKMTLNEISDPFVSNMGYHILMLTGRNEPKTLPYEDIKDLLRMRLEHIDSEFKLVKHFQELRAASKDNIELSEENLLAPFNCLFQ
jgi:parvulin-like peptidyl-prolyl isomerase